MNLQSLLHRPLALACGLTATAAALVCASTADAAPIVTSAAYQLRVDTTNTAPQTFASNVTQGVVDESLTALDLAQTGVSRAFAALQTQVGDNGFAGRGDTQLDLSNGISGEALASWVLSFTLATAHDFSGFFRAFGDGNTPPSIAFSLSLLGGSGSEQTLLSADEDVPELSFGGRLEAGNYRLSASSFSASADPGEFNEGRFDLRLDLRDVGVPPSAVPLPTSLALASLGLLAAGLAGRRAQGRAGPATAGR